MEAIFIKKQVPQKGPDLPPKLKHRGSSNVAIGAMQNSSSSEPVWTKESSRGLDQKSQDRKRSKFSGTGQSSFCCSLTVNLSCICCSAFCSFIVSVFAVDLSPEAVAFPFFVGSQARENSVGDEKNEAVNI